MGTEFLSYFSGLEDIRQPWKVRHQLEELLLVALCGVIADCDDWEDISLFGKERLEFFRQYLPFEHGIASDDTFRRVFSRLNPEAFSGCFLKWVASFQASVGNIIAIDGKTLRRSFSKDNNALHMISAFATESRLVLGQQAVDAKSNEITAIPALLKLLDIKGSTVTIDAKGCQRKIAEQIVAAKGDYIFGLKGNQGTLKEDVQLFFKDAFLTENLPTHSTVEKDHGRLETRKIRVVSDLNWLQERHHWPHLKSIIEIESTREIGDKISCEKRYYISSLDDNPANLLHAIRSHWAIENSLHWTLDMTFSEDQNRSRKKHSAANFAIIRHAALNLIRKNKQPKKSIKSSRKLPPGILKTSLAY